jgi:hypothetical protein
MASTNLQDLNLECEGCSLVFVTLDRFLRHPCMAAGIVFVRY